MHVGQRIRNTEQHYSVPAGAEGTVTEVLDAAAFGYAIFDGVQSPREKGWHVVDASDPLSVGECLPAAVVEPA